MTSLRDQTIALDLFENKNVFNPNSWEKWKYQILNIEENGSIKILY